MGGVSQLGVQAGKIMFLLIYLQTVVLSNEVSYTTQNLVWSRVLSCSLLKVFSCQQAVYGSVLVYGFTFCGQFVAERKCIGHDHWM